MARDTDQLSGFEDENTGGLLSGLLADEDVFDRRSLLRLGSWGVASVGAVIIALYANQSSIGLRREQLAAADLARQAQQIQSVAKQSQNEASRLASAIETLNDDRDRLYSRVTTLEQGLDSVTGAITRQTTTPPPAAAAPAVSSTAPPATSPPATMAATEPPSVAKNPPSAPPVVAPVATTVAAMVAKSTDKPPVDTTAPVQAPVTVSSIAKSSNANAQGPAPMPPPLMAAKSMMAPPDAAASKLIEPEKPAKADKPAAEAKPELVAAAPPADNAETDASEAAAPKLAVQRTEFGVDVGGANSVGGLRALWRGLLKSRSNAALTTLRPIMVIRERSSGLGMQLRLVAGPIGDAAAAAKICAGLIENDRPCETTVFDGQRLAMNADEPAAAAPAPDKAPVVKPAAKPSYHRHSSAKRAENVEPAKKPDSPSALSTFFSRR
jgi:hypothetical protein